MIQEEERKHWIGLSLFKSPIQKTAETALVLVFTYPLKKNQGYVTIKANIYQQALKTE